MHIKEKKTQKWKKVKKPRGPTIRTKPLSSQCFPSGPFSEGLGPSDLSCYAYKFALASLLSVHEDVLTEF